MTENTTASNMIPSNTSSEGLSEGLSEGIQYPRVFPLPDKWELPLTPQETQNDKDTDITIAESTQSSTQSSPPSSQKVFTHSLKKRSPNTLKTSTTLYDSILEQLRTYSTAGSQNDIPIMPPIKMEKTFMDDYFEEI